MWKNLSNIQKFLFIAVMCLIVPFAPEFIFLADIGGMELVFGFLVMYYKPMIIRVQSTINRIKFELEIFSIAFKNSSIFQPKVYFTQALFYSCALVVTGSVIYSSVFFLPALMLNGVLV
jgi:hypothetical protein